MFVLLVIDETRLVTSAFQGRACPTVRHVTTCDNVMSGRGVSPEERGSVTLGITLTLGACVRSASVCGGGSWVLHDNDDDADVTPQGRPHFVSLKSESYSIETVVRS